MSVDAITTEIAQVFPTNPESYKSPKIDFQQAVKAVDYTSLEKAIDVAFSYAKEIADRKELDKLKSLLTFNKDKEDKADKLRCYLVTNFNFPTYRYSWHNKPGLSEPATPHLNKHDAFKMLQLIDAYSTKQGYIQPQTKQFINQQLLTQQYITANKQKTVSELQKETGRKREVIKNLKKGVYAFTKQGEIHQIVRMKLYLLTADHKRFTYTKKNKTDPRTYNALSQVSKVYRTFEPCFQLQEFDIKSANPQILDRIIGSDNYRNVYANLMQAYGIDRNQAKTKFNATLNNHRLSIHKAKDVYFKAGYSTSEIKEILRITAKAKGEFYRYMATKESEIINDVIKANFNTKYVFRVHDAIYFLPELTTLDNPETYGVEFSQEVTPLANIPLELHQETSTPVLTALNVTSGNFRQDLHPNGKPILKYDNGYFFFYDRTFRRINANFNINASVVEKGHKKSPTDKDFLQRIDRLYTTLLYLNEDKALAKRIFENCIDNILSQPGISFNKVYVMTYIQRKKYDAIDAGKYFKERDYTYQGKPLKESVFQKLYHQAKGEMLKLQDYKILRKELRKLITEFENNNKLRFIDKAMFNRSRSTNTHAIINAIYSEIGVKRIDKIYNYNCLVNKFTHHKGSNNILGCVKNFTSLVNSTSENEISKEYNVSRPFAKQFKSIVKNKDIIIHKLENAIENLQELTEVEDLFNEPVKQKPIKQPQPTTPAASEYNQDILQRYLQKWNQESEMVKTSYKCYAHPFRAYAYEQYNKASGQAN